MNRQRIVVRLKLDLGRDLADQKTAACTDWLSARLLRRLEREDRYVAVAVAAAAADISNAVDTADADAADAAAVVGAGADAADAAEATPSHLVLASSAKRRCFLIVSCHVHS